MEYSVKNMNTCVRVERVNLLIVKQILLVSSIRGWRPEVHGTTVTCHFSHSFWYKSKLNSPHEVERNHKTATREEFIIRSCKFLLVLKLKINSYLERVYSLRPLWSRIAVNVPIQPRSRWSWPIFQVTKRGLKTEKERQ